MNIQGVLLFTGAVRQGSSCDKQRELNSPLHSISSEIIDLELEKRVIIDNI